MLLTTYQQKSEKELEGDVVDSNTHLALDDRVVWRVDNDEGDVNARICRRLVLPRTYHQSAIGHLLYTKQTPKSEKVC